MEYFYNDNSFGYNLGNEHRSSFFIDDSYAEHNILASEYSYSEYPERKNNYSLSFTESPNCLMPYSDEVNKAIEASIRELNCESQKSPSHQCGILLDEEKENSKHNEAKPNAVTKTTGYSTRGKNSIFNISKVQKGLFTNQVKPFIFRPETHTQSIKEKTNQSPSTKNTKYTKLYPDTPWSNPCNAKVSIIPPQEGFCPVKQIVKSRKVKGNTSMFPYFCYNCLHASENPGAFDNDVISDFSRYVIYTGQLYCRNRENSRNNLSGKIKVRNSNGSVDEETLEFFKHAIASYSYVLVRSLECYALGCRDVGKENGSQWVFVNLYKALRELIHSTKKLLSGILLYNEISYDKTYFLETVKIV